MDKILTAALASVAAAGGQVYPLVADETATGAYVVYERTKTTPLATLSGDTGCSIIAYTIHMMGPTYADCMDLTDGIRAACLGMAGTTSGGLTVQSVDIVDEKPQEYAKEMGVYHGTLSISCFCSKTEK